MDGLLDYFVGAFIGIVATLIATHPIKTYNSGYEDGYNAAKEESRNVRKPDHD